MNRNEKTSGQSGKRARAVDIFRKNNYAEFEMAYRGIRGGFMSLGIGAHANLIAEDENAVPYRLTRTSPPPQSAMPMICLMVIDSL